MARLFRTLALGLLLLAPLGTRAGEPFVPSWITNDPANRAVTIDLVAGWNGNNRFDNDNGYYQSGLTLLVPTGWTVTIDFRNQDATGPHSVLVTKPYTEAEMELQLTEQDAVVAGAYSKSPTKGQKVGANDRISFTAGKAGLYYLSCGVPAHLMQDMYLGLEVRDGLDRAMTVVHEDESAASDAPVRP
jgi:hypothetical protein